MTGRRAPKLDCGYRFSRCPARRPLDHFGGMSGKRKGGLDLGGERYLSVYQRGWETQKRGRARVEIQYLFERALDEGSWLDSVALYGDQE